jgi:hypothetical protein
MAAQQRVAHVDSFLIGQRYLLALEQGGQPFDEPVGQSERTAIVFLDLPAVAILPRQEGNSRQTQSFHIKRAVDGSLAPPRRRRFAGRATKFPREMALVGEAAGNGNFGQRHFRIEEQVLGLLDSRFDQPAVRRHARTVLEATRKIADG